MELLEKIQSNQNMNEAYLRVYKNKGASGVDGVTVDELNQYLKENKEELRQRIRTRKYQPQAALRVEIPKENSKMRMLEIPTVVDRVVQQAIHQVLSPIFEKQFSEFSYGFRPKRSCEMAIIKSLEFLNHGHNWVVDIDLERFFDTVHHDKLMRIIANTIDDGDVISLIRKNLVSGVMVKGKYEIEGENQATQIIRSSKVSVFFVDDMQMISKKDIRSVKLIQDEAAKLGAETHVVDLESQYRCSGSGNYIAWLDSLFGFTTKDIPLEGEFDFNVVSNPHELIEEVVEKRGGRLLAGYAWDWNKNAKSGQLPNDVVIEEYDFALPWNDPNRIDWAIHPDCANQIGCIHTVQGLEMDYVGVIIGKDLGYDPETKSIIVRREEFKDKGARPAKPKKGQEDPLYNLVRNTYKTLMTRGMKGCYVYCCDGELGRYIEATSRM